jgi:tellurite methyltransferase
LVGGDATKTRRYWNERHGAAIFSDEPAPWLFEQRALLEHQPRGRALDIACGGGRNALFLAELGFDVDALDISDVAIARVQRLAAKRRRPISARRVDLSAAPAFPNPPYQVVLDFFYLERSLFDQIAAALAPGGLLLFQTFVGERAADQSSGPRFGLEPGELRRAFANLELLHYDEVEIGSERAGRRMTARLAARARRSAPGSP